MLIRPTLEAPLSIPQAAGAGPRAQEPDQGVRVSLVFQYLLGHVNSTSAEPLQGGRMGKLQISLPGKPARTRRPKALSQKHRAQFRIPGTG